jgi:hypothetical protein
MEVDSIPSCQTRSLAATHRPREGRLLNTNYFADQKGLLILVWGSAAVFVLR